MIQNEKEMRYRMKREKGNINERNLERNIMKKEGEGKKYLYIKKEQIGIKKERKTEGWKDVSGKVGKGEGRRLEEKR
jgi:hypothetical protein